jgi:hypothetical protein
MSVKSSAQYTTRMEATLPTHKCTESAENIKETGLH